MNEYSISRKKASDLYTSVSNDIIDARIKLKKTLIHIDKKDWDLLDTELFTLSVFCPENAINIFKKKVK